MWSPAYIFNKENNKEGPKFKVGDNVGISKYKIIFTKGYVPNWSEEVFVIKNTVLWTYVMSDLNEEEVLECFTKKNCSKQSKNTLSGKSNKEKRW